MGYTTPEWTSVAKTPDGRECVTDGSIAIDISCAKVEELPEAESSASWFSDALYRNWLAERRELFSVTDVKASKGNPEIVVAPGGLQLEERYVTYIRQRFGSLHRISFWQQRRMLPVVIIFDGVDAVGALKVFAQN